MAILNKYLKKLDYESYSLKEKISLLQKEIQALEETKKEIEDEYFKVESERLSNPQEIYMQKMYMLKLKEKISYIELEKKKRENDLRIFKEILAGKNAEKKAIQKYKYKQEKEILKKEQHKETEMACEFFNRNYY